MMRAAAEALADVVVGVAFELEGHALRARTRRSSGRRCLGTCRCIVSSGRPCQWRLVISLPRIVPTTRLMFLIGSVARDLFAAFDRGLAEVEQRGDVERLVEAVVLRLGAEAADFRADIRLDKASSRSRCPWPSNGRRRPSASSTSVRPTISLSLRKPSWAMISRTSCAMNFMKFTACSGSPVKFLRSTRILRGDADRAGVEMADAHHDAAERDERRGGETEFLGAEQRGDDHVAAGLQLAVRLDGDAAAQIVQHQRLVRFGEAEFPRQAGVLDGRLRRGAGAAVESGDEHDIRMRLGDARGDGADADFGHQLHADARVAVRVLQVVDQLREVFDRVDVVVRRRRDEADAGSRVPHLGDPRIDLGAGKLAAFAGLRALRHLDLQFPGLAR